MKVTAQPTWEQLLTIPAHNSLTRNLDRITHGSSDVLETPFMSSVDDEEIFDRIEDVLSKVDVTPKLREIEDENRSKFGPRSIAVPWVERRKSLYAYYESKSAVEVDFMGLPRGRLRPISVANAIDSLVSRSSSGLPYMVRKGSLDSEMLSKDLSADTTAWPCVLFTRTQEQEKTRNVWGYPVLDTIREMMYAKPYIEFEKTLPWRAALLGPDMVDRAITNLLDARGQRIVYCVDFSAFDSSITPRHIEEAMADIAGWFQVPQDLTGITDRLINIPIMTPDGEISGPHGVPSGTAFTNSVDSMVQYRISGVNSNRCQIQGDDGVYVVDASERSILEDAFESEDLTLNKEKSFVTETDEAVYLQRYYSSSYPRKADGALGGIYSLYRAALRIKYLERWTDFEREGITGNDFFSLRTLMILENCKHHPGFAEFVKYVQSLDKQKLRFSRGSLVAFSKMQESRVRAGVLATNPVSGFLSFEAVKVAASA